MSSNFYKIIAGKLANVVFPPLRKGHIFNYLFLYRIDWQNKNSIFLPALIFIKLAGKSPISNGLQGLNL